MTATKTKNQPKADEPQAQNTTVKRTSKSMEAKIYDITGHETGKITLPERVFGLPWNADLVHQVMVGQLANARTPVAHTKDRGEVRGGGRKPWRQKGTGRARHGSRRSPIWIGGGVTFGPRNEKDYSKKINKKMRAKALFTILSKKLKDEEILFVDSISFNESKTKQAVDALCGLSKIKGFENLSQKKKNAALITLSSHDENTAKSFRNFGNIMVEEFRNLNAVTALTYKYLIVTDPEAALKVLENKRKPFDDPKNKSFDKAKDK